MAPGFTMLDNDSVIDRLPDIDGTAIKVYLALARRADSLGRCWPSVETISRDSGLHRRAVQLAIGRLKNLGLLVIHNQPGKSTLYQLTSAPPCAQTDLCRETA